MSQGMVISKQYVQNVSGSTYQKLTWQIIAMHRQFPDAVEVRIEFKGTEFPKIKDSIVDQLVFIKEALKIPVYLNGDNI